eukprot:TRINITY_DN3489_c0_g1_i10.p2 TRINITY_DN3489_c0_g1~~TRINITY_DN3489_c0_g1_i10.p2  ORF type:complete len:109 (-),score=0.88 TRINITY_DN3489_c0_g1_i10:1033-1359(-)
MMMMMRTNLFMLVMGVSMMTVVPLCMGYTTCDRANDCQVTIGTHMCINIPNTLNRTITECRECDPTLPSKDCQCHVGSYCVSDPKSVRRNEKDIDFAFFFQRLEKQNN